MGIKFQHCHLNADTGEWIGKEHAIIEWPKKRVDGYNAENRIVVEFLGNDVHGYPPLWEHDIEKLDRYDYRMEGRYADTSEKMSKLKALGYRVLYIWQADMTRKCEKSLLPGVFREFDEHLEW
jgi:hypothetical protein